MQSYLTAEISASAVKANLQLLRSRLAAPTKLCAVVKADCYGHALNLLLPVISPLVDHLGVATPEEAINVRRLGYHGPIITFFSSCAYSDGHELRDALEELVAHHVTLTVVSMPEVESVALAAKRVGARPVVHVKIDTSMGRSGVLWDQAGELVARIRREQTVQLGGLYTHLATADETDKRTAAEQLEHFAAAVRAAGGKGELLLHAANSAGLIDLPEAHLDMVRPGIAIYGYQPSDEMHHRLALRPAMRVWGRLMQVKNVPAGSRVGYGLTYTFDRDSRVGLVPIGYGDGYFRNLSNRATMRVRGRDVPIRGRVSMDQITIDLSLVPEAQVGDVVEIVSSDPAAPHSVENLARLAGTIPYEITCRLGRRVQRVLVE
jgi:alanine racemase